MQTLRLIVSLALAASLPARADTLFPAQDTSSSKGKLSATAGKATTLAVSATGKAFVFFDLTNLPVDVQGADIVSARLRVYFPSVTKAGDIELHTVTANGTLWTETTAATEPAIDSSIIQVFHAANVVAKNFAEVDVTGEVQAWRTTPASNYGFAFVAGGVTKVTLGAKEGPGSGYPCQLELEIAHPVALADGSIGTTMIENGAVTTAKLASGAVGNTQLANSSLSVTASTGLTGGGSVALGGSVSLSLGSNLTLGGTTTGTFAGDGSALTGLSATNLSGALTVATLPDTATMQINTLSNVPEINNSVYALGIALLGNNVYFANSGGGLRIIDVSNPASPVLRDDVAEGLMGNGYGRGVAISGIHAYLANGNAGLAIIDVSDSSNPIVSSMVPESAMGNGGAFGVIVSGNYAYVANYTDGLRIIDISNPTNPVLKGNVPESAMGSGTAIGVAVSGNYAYLANSSDGLRIIDISNPASPALKGKVSGSGTAVGVTVSGSYAYLANSSDGLRIIDISDPVNPVVDSHISEPYLGVAYTEYGSANSLAVSGSYAFLANGDAGCAVIDGSNPQNPTVKGIFSEIPFPNGNAYGIAVSGNYLFIANSYDGLRICSFATSTATATGSSLGSSQIVAAGGNVGIGRTPTFNKLEVEGDASKTVASGWSANSDRRIKLDVRPVANALETLDRVRPVAFRYTDEYRRAHPSIVDREYYNVIAQDFREVFPDAVHGSGEHLADGSEILQVDTYPLTIYSAAAVQELNAKLKARDEEIADLKKRLERIEARLGKP